MKRIVGLSQRLIFLRSCKRILDKVIIMMIFEYKKPLFFTNFVISLHLTSEKICIDWPPGYTQILGTFCDKEMMGPYEIIDPFLSHKYT